jgi:hypothetical protein
VRVSIEETGTKTGISPTLSDYINSRCQVDLIDMQSEPDGAYRFIMNCRDYLTKFTILPHLKSKIVKEVAYQLMDIFSMFGAPFILQSDNGREFANKIIQNLAQMWPGGTTTTRKFGLKDSGLSKARKPELCIQALLHALMRL